MRRVLPRVRHLVLALLPVLAAVLVSAPARAHGPRVTWHPRQPRVGDVAWIHVRAIPDGAAVEGSVDGRPLAFFPYAGGQAALVGFDVDLPPGRQAWRVAVVSPGREPERVSGAVRLRARPFPVQRLTLPPAMVDLDPQTERRAEAEAETLRTVLRMVTPVRLWRGRFTRPVAGDDLGSGFGARRIINGQPRMPHTGVDYAAPRGTPVVAANDGRVVLVAEFFFPGRLVVIDHGLGLHTLYFHLDEVKVESGATVGRGEPVGTVGATGRATGPHLHFGAHMGAARIDPSALLGLRILD